MDRQAEVAPKIQDDFDLGEGGFAELQLADRPENQARFPSGKPAAGPAAWSASHRGAHPPRATRWASHSGWAVSEMAAVALPAWAPHDEDFFTPRIHID